MTRKELACRSQSFRKPVAGSPNQLDMIMFTLCGIAGVINAKTTGCIFQISGF